MRRIDVVGLAVKGPDPHPWSMGRWIWEVVSLAAIIAALILVVYGMDGFLALPDGTGTGYPEAYIEVGK